MNSDSQSISASSRQSQLHQASGVRLWRWICPTNRWKIAETETVSSIGFHGSPLCPSSLGCWIKGPAKAYMESTAMICGKSTNCCTMQSLLYLRFNTKHETSDMIWPPWEDVLVSLGLDGTVVTIYNLNISLAVDLNISRAVESMQAFPQHLMHKAMQKLRTIMQNRSLTSGTYPDVSKDFLSSFANAILAEAYRLYVQGYLVTQKDLL